MPNLISNFWGIIFPLIFCDLPLSVSIPYCQGITVQSAPPLLRFRPHDLAWWISTAGRGGAMTHNPRSDSPLSSVLTLSITGIAVLLAVGPQSAQGRTVISRGYNCTISDSDDALLSCAVAGSGQYL